MIQHHYDTTPESETTESESKVTESETTESESKVTESETTEKESKVTESETTEKESKVAESETTDHESKEQLVTMHLESSPVVYERAPMKARAAIGAQSIALPVLQQGAIQSGNGWNWDGSVLTLDGFVYDGNNGFNIKGDASIVLKNENRFTGDANTSFISSYDGSLIWSGDGTLYADNTKAFGPDIDNGDWDVLAPLFYCGGKMIFNGGTLFLNGGGLQSDAGFEVNDGQLNITTPDGFVIEDEYGPWVSAAHGLLTNGSVSINGGEMNFQLGKFSAGIMVSNYDEGTDVTDVTMTGGTVNVTGNGDSAILVGYPFGKTTDSDAIHISGGTLKAKVVASVLRSVFGGNIVLDGGQFEMSNTYGNVVSVDDPKADEIIIKAANYDAVDEVLGKIPEDLSLYTEASVKALNDAKTAVVWDKNFLDQSVVNGYAAAIQAAIDGLTYRGADYKTVNEVIGKIPEDLSMYTEASVKALNDVRTAIAWDKNVTEQSVVNGYAAAMQAAIDGLTYREADYKTVDEALGKIPEDLSLYTEASVKALNDAKTAIAWDKNVTEQSVVNGYAAAVQAAIDGLTYRGADYKAVDEALGKIPEDLSLYTEASLKALNDAKTAIAWDKNVTEQSVVDGYAAAVKAAVNGLAYKTADYTAVDKALEKIPEDLSMYTEESVKALNDAKAAIVRDKNVTEQSAIDAYAAAIEKAIAGLTKKQAETETENKVSEEKPAAVSKTSDSPKTGDPANVLLWSLLFIVSGGVVAALTLQKKKKNMR